LQLLEEPCLLHLESLLCRLDGFPGRGQVEEDGIRYTVQAKPVLARVAVAHGHVLAQAVLLKLLSAKRKKLRNQGGTFSKHTLPVRHGERDTQMCADGPWARSFERAHERMNRCPSLF